MREEDEDFFFILWVPLRGTTHLQHFVLTWYPFVASKGYYTLGCSNGPWSP